MRQFFWPVACALALSGCPDGGGGSATADQGTDSTTGNVDAEVDMIFTGPDMTGPGPDMAVPDTGMPDPDTGMPDTGMPDPDTGMPDPDMGMPDPDMAMPDPDMAPRECELGQSRDCPGECAGGQQDCGPDGDWAECVYPEELCNGADDDCDGNTDEDFAELGAACMVGVGACTAAGENICDAVGAGIVCNAVPGMPQVEGCDGVDNDCDAQTDEALMEVCYDGPDGTLGVGVCAQGMRTCEAGAFGACVNAVLPADEACDGADNDCDGVLDESMGGAALVEGCYDGPAGTQDVGVCRGGQRACVAGGFGPCEDQALPGVEICDLVDNDCDGAADNTPGGCQCQPGEVGECYTGPDGTAGVGACTNGNQFCDADGRFGACNDENVPQAESCDAVDNDCDGEVDNDVAGAGEDCNAGVGACLRDGMTICDGERGEVVCSAEPGAPVDEACNAIDDDCDGTTDEDTGLGDACTVGVGACAANGAQICDDAGGVVCDAQPGEARAEQCNGIDDDCDGSTDESLGLGDACDIGVGACNREGALRCADNGQVECSVVAGPPAPEACDGLDNDCDNQTDEGNPGGGQDCNTGLDGICSAGVRICAGGAFNCDQRAFPAAEVCDGLDNDCNGDVDDDGDGPLQRACYDGPAITQDVGLCRGGQSTCAGGEFGDCVGQITPRPEVCDSADNDCNGDVDDLPAGMCVCEAGETRACYSGDAGTQNVGVCRAGRQTCQANGQGYGGCEGEVLPSAEVCDGDDNDCNGDVDDAAGVGVPCVSGEGECRRDGGLICDARTGDLVCDAAPGEAQPEICDGLDNDCNGNRDDVEGLGDRCTNGGGICQRAGNQVCDLNIRELVCNAVPGEPEAEVCDGADNDCDESTDEDLAGVGRRCTAGQGACLAAGETICAGREGIQCGAEAGEPTPEVCDLVDNDCDQQTDEEAAGVGDVCVVGEGICARDGVQSCSPNGGVQCDGQAGAPGLELCDGEDNDCDGDTDEALNCDVFRSCAHALQGGNVADGIYVIDADGEGDAEPQSIWCDQTTDGGGWTLVGSSQNTTLNDQSSAWYADLVTLAPTRGNDGIWDGLRPLGERFDVRFTCRAAVAGADQPFDVDLSFYDTPWYTEFTTGTDAESCFSENTGYQDDSPVPARRDNLGVRFRRRGDLYDASGYLEGEDSCSDVGDFTVDFDNRGMDADEDDGTDWGEDDTSRKCGARGLAGGQWFVWARERPRVAVVGLSLAVTTVLHDAGILADRLAYDPALPGQLTHENYDTIVIGRYAGSWPRMTQDLKEALDVFGRDGGNIVTEWEGASIFMSVYDGTYRYRNGAPQQLGWFGGRIGAGGSRGGNTPITPTVPGDPIFGGVPNPIQAGGATDFFFTLADVGGVEFPVTLETETLATFAGNGTAAFPDGELGAIERGRYCGGHMLFASFDWQDDPDNAGFGALIPNLVNAANAPPPADIAEACKAPTRSTQMVCGNSNRDVTDFGLTSRVVNSCVPNGDVQVMWVTRSGADQIDGAQARTYLNGGGIIVGEFSTSDELYNSIFFGNVVQGDRFGACRDNMMPQVQFTGSDGFWQDNLFEPIGQSGCGHDLTAFPNLVRLGGWTPETTQLAYRDQGRGRVWFVEADWQDDDAGFNDASRGLMRYMATHAAGGNSGRGAVFNGVREDQNINEYLQRGFRPCLRTPYNSVDVELEDVQEACHGDVLMMACREVGSNILNVAAIGSRNEVFQDTGESDDPNPHNGVGWYYSANESWGFAPGGQAISRASCDTTNPDSNDRLCWHTGATGLASGWRCGSDTALFSAEWERVVLDRFGDVPIDRLIVIE
ncbi:MAG: hypothetical protein ACI9U2_000122 [Bradymonadia bacterium]|jgi:hypothetical protein